MAKIDWTKEVIPQMTAIDETEGIEAVQQCLFEATPQQLKKFQDELEVVQDRLARKIAASVWN